MEQRELGRTGLRVSVLGFGGSEIGFESAEPGRVRRLLQEALDAGLNVIDTAECYGDSESLVGQAVADRRQDFHLFTKCGHFEGTGRDDWSSASLEKSIARSLARLRTDHVDLLQLHTCTEDDLRRGDVIEVVERARQRPGCVVPTMSVVTPGSDAVKRSAVAMDCARGWRRNS